MANRLLEEAEVEIKEFFRATSIMTKEIHFFNEDASKSELLELLERNNFDLAILKLDNGSYGYVLRKELENFSEEKVIEIIHEIQPGDTINYKDSIADVINKFSAREYIFVTEGSKLKGLITYADLNKPPIYAFCYIVISQFETLLRKIVDKKYEERQWLEILFDDHLRDIGGVYISEKAKGIEISLLKCTGLKHLKEIIRKESSLLTSIGYASRKDFDEKLKSIINWRNTVMHNRDIVLKRDGGKELYNFIEDLGDQMEKLNTWYASCES